MKIIQRTTEVVSVSLPKSIAQKLETLRKIRGQSRSSFIAFLIGKLTEEERWRKIYAQGEKTTKQFRITSEEDIDRIVHGKKS